MRAKPRPVRVKPAVAFTNRDRALERLASKRALLVMLAQREPVGETETAEHKRILASLPKSVTAFNKWAAEGVPQELLVGFPGIQSNAKETLSNSDLVASVEKAIALVVAAQAANEAVPTPKALKVARLQRDLALANALREIAERAVLNLRIALMDAENKAKALLGRALAAEREGARQSASRSTKPEKVDKGSKVVQLNSAHKRPKTRR